MQGRCSFAATMPVISDHRAVGAPNLTHYYILSPAYPSRVILLCGAGLIVAILAVAIRRVRAAHVYSSISRASRTEDQKSALNYSQPDTWQMTYPPMPQPTIELEEEALAREVAGKAAAPRRRSYTKAQNGVEVQGEIIVAEAWKRHTKVFGGGVCQACLESEQKMQT